MSLTLAPVLSIASITLIGFYSVQNYYLPLKDQQTKDKEHIQALEEEIVRLKREMRICGIIVHSSPSPSPSPPKNHRT